MKYLCLIYDNEKDWTNYSPEEQGKVFEAHMAFSKAAGEAGKLLGGEALHPTSMAVTVSVRDGKNVYTDGPFMETKEQLGGYYMLECADINEAREWAAKIPEAKSGQVEVRPIMVIEGTESPA